LALLVELGAGAKKLQVLSLVVFPDQTHMPYTVASKKSSYFGSGNLDPSDLFHVVWILSVNSSV